MNINSKNKRESNNKIIYILKRFILKSKFKSKIQFERNLRILGPLPYLKIPQNGKIQIGKNVILNSTKAFAKLIFAIDPVHMQFDDCQARLG